MFSIITVCTGNICRSPMAEFQLRDYLGALGLDRRISVDSAATTSWEEGNPMDPRAQNVLQRHNIPSASTQKPAADHKARSFESSWFVERDLILAMDSGHYEYLTERAPAGERSKIRMFCAFDPEFSSIESTARPELKNVEDPWYGTIEDFENVYTLIKASLPGIVNYAQQKI